MACKGSLQDVRASRKKLPPGMPNTSKPVPDGAGAEAEAEAVPPLVPAAAATAGGAAVEVAGVAAGAALRLILRINTASVIYRTSIQILSLFGENKTQTPSFSEQLSTNEIDSVAVLTILMTDCEYYQFFK